MTKITKTSRIVLIILAFLLIICIAFGIAVCIKINYIPVKIECIYDNVYDMQSVSVEANSEDYKVLKISDTHLINGKTKNDLKTLAFFEEVLNRKRYDLIILNGDIVDGFNLNFSFNKYTAIDSFASIIEDHEIIWTFVPGNNDGEMQGDNKKMISYLMQYEHFVVGNTPEVDGDVNFVIDIESKGEVAHSIILLDSHSRKIPIIGSYDHMKESQIDFVKRIAENRSAFISVFFHMPTAIFEKAFNEGNRIPEYNQFAPSPYNKIKDNSRFDEGIADCSNISLISCSHIHSNNMLSFYNERYYELNSASGFGADLDDHIKPVVTEININLASTTVENIYQFSQY